MDTAESHALNGKVVTGKELRTPKALALHSLLRQGKLRFARLVETRHFGPHDVIVVDVEPELPQHPVHDIRAVERFAIGFAAADQELPLVLSVRTSFPVVPHLNLTKRNEPKNLCLSELPKAEQWLTWTPAGLLSALQRWLQLTARGELHGSTQALEPVFFPSAKRLIVPAAFFSGAPELLPAQLALYAIGETTDERLYRAFTADQVPAALAAGTAETFLAFTYEAKPQLHGLIQEQPQTLSDLHVLLSAAGDDFIGRLQQVLAQWATVPTVDLELPLLCLVRVPKQRAVGSAAETFEVWAFVTAQSTREVDAALAAWASGLNAAADGPVPVAEAVPDQALGILINLLNPVSALTPEAAAEYNGLDTSSPTRYVAVGVGALGSQLVTILHKAGHGDWMLLDDDLLLPHNLARHELSGRHVGRPKSEALAEELNTLFEVPRVQFRVADVLSATISTLNPLNPLYAAADMLLDTSASVAVARQLALDVPAPARRVSIFLNPSGSDLVMLAEPANRAIRLDYLEMEYYRALTLEPGLDSHLLGSGPAVRYAYGCRDKSSRIPQDQVALLAAVGARALRTATAGAEPVIKIWQTQADLTVTAVTAPPVRYRKTDSVGGWTLHISTRLMRVMAAHRATRLGQAKHLFRETGGVLLGAFDTQRKQIYVVDHLPAPTDSQERSDSFIRGVEGLAKHADRIKRLTNFQLDYVGEWHSHPPKNPTTPSTDDRKLFTWLQELRCLDGLPPVMAIVGDDINISWYVDDLAHGRVHTTLHSR